MRGKLREFFVRYVFFSICIGVAVISCVNRGKVAEGGQYTGYFRFLQRLRYLRWLYRSVWVVWLYGGWRQLSLVYVFIKRGLGMVVSFREFVLFGGYFQEFFVRFQVVWRKDSQVLIVGYMAFQDVDGCIFSFWSGLGFISFQQVCKELVWRDGDRVGGLIKVGIVFRWGVVWDSETGLLYGCQDFLLG